MAAIPAINAVQIGSFACNEATMTADDGVVVDANKKQLLVLRNPTGGALTCKVDGDASVSVSVPGVGVISTSGGYDIVVPAGESRAVSLSSISEYCKGTVHLLGAPAMKATLFNL